MVKDGRLKKEGTVGQKKIRDAHFLKKPVTVTEPR